MSEALLLAAAAVFVAAEVGVWRVVIRRWSHRLPLVPRELDRTVPWGLADVMVAVVLLFVLSTLAIVVVNQRFGVTKPTPPEELALPYYQWRIPALAFASLATLAAASILIKLRHGQFPFTRASHSAATHVLHTFWYDVRLGTAAFLVLAPPIYGLQLLLVQWYESKHPIVEILLQHRDPGLILACVFSTVLVAPVFEEFLFRGLLQGWLEKLVAHAAWPTNAVEPKSPTGEAPGQGREAGDTSGTTEAIVLGQADPIDRLAPYLPVVASSSIFAALHVSHGPDWVPLFFLALGLGYLFRQTHRLLPGIIVHLLLNAVSMAMLLFELLNQ